MKVSIDVIVFTSDTAIGMVSGELDLVAVPQTGNIVCFSSPFEGVAHVGGFSGHLTVKHVLFRPAKDDSGVTIMFDDIVADSRETALEIMRYLEQGFGLFADEFETKPG
jgi:hypothetical protein